MKPSTLQLKAERLLAIDTRRKAHNAALSRLHSTPITGYDGYDETEQHEERGLKMWRKLRRIEAVAHDATTAQCNGEAYNGQPFRDEIQWQEFKGAIAARVASVFGFTHLHPPKGFFLNSDPRGYALKLDPEKCTVPDGMQTDWGGNGILAAEIDE